MKESRAGAGLRVGIVGSGMAGSGVAYFLRETLGGAAEIVVWERDRRIGGRVREMEIGGVRVPIGGSMAHSSNRYFAELSRRLGLTPFRTQGRTTGVWDGTRFVVQLGDSGWRTLLRVLTRYGRSPARARQLVRQMIARLVPIYDRLEQGECFASPRELFGGLGLYELSQRSSTQYFRENGISDRFLTEIIDGVSRANYGQSSEIHALANLVSLAGASVGGHLIMLEEGNSTFCRRMLEQAGAVLRLGAPVTTIEGLAEGGYRLRTEVGEAERFDAVILATPLELAGIRISGVPLPEAAHLSRPFQETYVTLVVGQLNPGYFGRRSPEELPGVILTKESPAIPFSAIGVWGRRTASGEVIYKLFSRQELSAGLLLKLFSRKSEVHRMVWKAYPVLRPIAQWPPFVLHDGLYYINAMESGVSTMETELIASRNVANLVARKEVTS